MKKFSVILVALMTFFLVSCKKSDPVQKMVDAVNTFTEKLQKVDSREAFMNLQKEMATEIDKLDAEAKKELGEDFQPTEEQEKLVNEAMEKFQTAAAEALKKFTPESVEGVGNAEGEDSKAQGEDLPEVGEEAPANKEEATGAPTAGQ